MKQISIFEISKIWNVRNSKDLHFFKYLKFPKFFNFKKHQISKNFQFRTIKKFQKTTIWKTIKIPKNFQFRKLSYILSVWTIQTDVNIRNKFENKKNRVTRLSLFQYSKFRIFEISAVLHLVVTNFDPHPSHYNRKWN